MTPLEAARRLQASRPFYCPGCSALQGANGEHADDCPWLQMPRIVKALEATDRLLQDRPPRGGSATRKNPRGLCYYCLGDGLGVFHEPTCLWVAVMGAMAGAPPPPDVPTDRERAIWEAVRAQGDDVLGCFHDPPSSTVGHDMYQLAEDIATHRRVTRSQRDRSAD